MRVRDCVKCDHYRRRVWSSCYKPQRYHAIGVSHAYGYCVKYEKRCLDVKKCEMKRLN